MSQLANLLKYEFIGPQIHRSRLVDTIREYRSADKKDNSVVAFVKSLRDFYNGKGPKGSVLDMWNVIGHSSALGIHQIHNLLQLGVLYRVSEEISAGNYWNAAGGSLAALAVELSKGILNYGTVELAKRHYLKN